MAASK